MSKSDVCSFSIDQPCTTLTDEQHFIVNASATIADKHGDVLVHAQTMAYGWNKPTTTQGWNYACLWQSAARKCKSLKSLNVGMTFTRKNLVTV